MRIPRCYVDQALSPGQTLPLGERASAHLVRVLRLAAGDACVLFNGDGRDYPATLTLAGKRGVEVAIESMREVGNESPLRITLLQGIARGEKMDLILQKATELGVHRVVPVVTERTEVKLDAERGERRLQHWHGVLIAACEQCGRARLPQLESPQPLAQALISFGAPQAYMLDPDAAQRPADLPETLDAATLLVGPEGGLSPRDVQAAQAAGYRGLRLGPRILRTETAGLAALAALQALRGDF